MPVLVTLGARANGDRVVLDMRLVGEESAASRTDAGASLTARHLRVDDAVKPRFIDLLRGSRNRGGERKCVRHRHLHSKMMATLSEFRDEPKRFVTIRHGRERYGLKRAVVVKAQTSERAADVMPLARSRRLARHYVFDPRGKHQRLHPPGAACDVRREGTPLPGHVEAFCHGPCDRVTANAKRGIEPGQGNLACGRNSDQMSTCRTQYGNAVCL